MLILDLVALEDLVVRAVPEVPVAQVDPAVLEALLVHAYLHHHDDGDGVGADPSSPRQWEQVGMGEHHMVLEELLLGIRGMTFFDGRTNIICVTHITSWNPRTAVVVHGSVHHYRRHHGPL